MNLYHATGGLVNKRIPITVDRVDEILSYGETNVYPQVTEQVLSTSGVATQSVNLFREFINGEGFEDEAYAMQPINEKGQTIADCFFLNSADYATHKGFAIHFNFNAFGEIAEAHPVPFKFVRFGIPDENGMVHDVKFNLNWDKDPFRYKDNIKRIKTFPIFNPENLEAEFSEVGFENHPGQMLYWTPVKNTYPASTIDPIFESVQSSGEIQNFELGSLQNRFNVNYLFKYWGKFEDDEEERAFQKKISQFTGSGSAGSAMVVEMGANPEDVNANIIEEVPNISNDKLYDVTDVKVRNRIVESFGQPKILHGITSDTALFNQENAAFSTHWYNDKVRQDRKIFEQNYMRWGEFWPGLNPSENYTIVPQQFTIDGAADQE